MEFIILCIVGYLLFHAGHSHSNYRHYRARGVRGVNLYWSSFLGPYASMRLPGGFRLGHRL